MLWGAFLGGLVIALGGLGRPEVAAQSVTPTDLSARAAAIARLATPAPMVTIPAGWFLMGSLRKEGDLFGLAVPYDDTESPQRRIWLDAYAIDRDEVSLGNYLRWLLLNHRGFSPELARQLAATGMLPDHTLTAWPAFLVSWFEATDYCRSAGKRLPTEAEWEKAARGTEGQLFPWGMAAPDLRRAVFAQDVSGVIPPVAPVDSFAEGRSPYGLAHMAGNVAEWVQDWNGIDYYVSMPDRNPPGPASGRYKVVRGGSWRSNQAILRTATRSGAPPDQRAQTIGFRCAKSAT